MATGTTKYGDISPRTAAYAVRQFLEHARPILVLERFATPYPIPKNKGQTVKLRRPIPFTPKTAPLVEGVTPTPTALRYEDVTVNLLQYGDWSELTDVIQDTHEDPVLNHMVMLHGENAGATREQVLYGILKAGTTVFYANKVASRSNVVDVVQLSDIRRVVRYLRAQKAKFVTRILDGSVRIGTQPIEASFIAICHTDLEHDIRSIAGFVPVAQYGSRRVVSEHELGTVENVRFIISPELAPWADAGGTTGAGTTRVSTGGTNVDVYPILIFGQDAYATTPLRGASSAEIMVINPNKPEKSDPLGQRGSVAWKTWFAGAITNQTWIARLEVAATLV